MPDAGFGFNTPFAEQLEFFRAKLNLPSERWDDIWKSAHDRAFIVAGAGKADLLNDLHRAVEKSIAQGTGLEEFRRDFRQIVFNNGWTGWTGEGSLKGEAWRTRVIYQTNMATSYAAGRWQQLTDPGLLKLMPNWRYVHADGVAHPRPLHLSWHGTTLPHDHPFWQTHFAPNGWGCHCRIVPVGKREAIKPPPEGWDKIDPKTGAQIGIDKGFDYAPGANATAPLRQMVQDKLVKYPPAITKALSHDVSRYINAHEDIAGFVKSVMQDKTRDEPLWLGFVDNFEAVGKAAGQDVKGYLVLLPAETPRHVEGSHGHDGGTQRIAIPEDYRQVWPVLSGADTLESGHVSRHGNATVVAWKRIGADMFRLVFEVLPGKKNRTLALISLVIKTK